MKEAKKKELRVIFNPSPMEDYIKGLDLSGVTLFFVNEIEGEQITGEKEPDKILKAFAEKYPSAAVALTLGTEGAYYQLGEERYFQEAYKVKAIDTTAEGDTFTGFFVKEYFTTGNPADALKIATKASAIAVTRFGAAQSIPKMQEIVNSQ